MDKKKIVKSEIESAEQDLAARVEPINQATKAAFAVGFSIIFYTYAKSELSRFASEGWLLGDVLHVGMVLLIVVLGSLWLQSGNNEIKIFCYWLRPGIYQPPTDLSIVASIIGIGVLISLLAFTSKWAHYFGLFFLLYVLVDIWWARLIRGNLKELFQCTEKEWRRADGANREKRLVALEALDVIRIYYFERPQLFRRQLMAWASVLGIFLAWYGYLSKVYLMTVLSYIVFVLIIIISEIYVGKWRIDRDRRLRVLAQDFRAAELAKGRIGQR